MPSVLPRKTGRQRSSTCFQSNCARVNLAKLECWQGLGGRSGALLSLVFVRKDHCPRSAQVIGRIKNSGVSSRGMSGLSSSPSPRHASPLRPRIRNHCQRPDARIDRLPPRSGSSTGRPIVSMHVQQPVSLDPRLPAAAAHDPRGRARGLSGPGPRYPARGVERLMDANLAIRSNDHSLIPQPAAQRGREYRPGSLPSWLQTANSARRLPSVRSKRGRPQRRRRT